MNAEMPEPEKTRVNLTPMGTDPNCDIFPLSCYNELDKRFASTNAGKATKKSRIESTVLNSFTPLSKADICGILPDVSPTTVEAVLGEMVRGGRVRRIGAGRASRYVRRT